MNFKGKKIMNVNLKIHFIKDRGVDNQINMMKIDVGIKEGEELLVGEGNYGYFVIECRRWVG